jgi:hypothetical protein
MYDLACLPGYGTGGYSIGMAGNCWMQDILPYMEQGALYTIFQPYIGSKTSALSWPSNQTIVPTLLCPSDPVSSKPKTQYLNTYFGFFGNYVLCAGSTGFGTNGGASMNGIEYPQSRTRMTDVTDGLANTLLGSELIVTAPNNGDTGACALGSSGNIDYRGCYFNDLAAGVVFETLYPPNTSVGDYLWNGCSNQPFNSGKVMAPCSGCSDGSGASQIVSARSYHIGGVVVLMGDGSVQFMSNDVSLTNVWQPLGTRAGGETIGSY